MPLFATNDTTPGKVLLDAQISTGMCSIPRNNKIRGFPGERICSCDLEFHLKIKLINYYLNVTKKHFVDR